MISISQMLATLSEKQRAILHYAHENHISQFIEYSPGKYIGVDAERISTLCIERTTGRWSVGTIRNKNEVLHEAANGRS